MKSFNNRSNLNHIHTDTYLSTFNHEGQVQNKDKALQKAIKQNNVEIIVPKDREANAQVASLFDEEKELMGVIIEMRKKYDQTKIDTTQTEKNLTRLEEQRIRLEAEIIKMEEDQKYARQRCEEMYERQKEVDSLVEYGDYVHETRLNMKDTLKHDILHYKKGCFDCNVKMIRTNTVLKELSKRSTTRQHQKSKVKLVLNSLQQTVQTRQVSRLVHLQEVEDIVRKKMDNYELKGLRDQFLQDSLYKALTDKLPEEKQLLGTFKCEKVLREVLRTKMRKLVTRYQEVETSFNIIRKTTRIKATSEFINEFLQKEMKYGNLLESIERAEKKIVLEKESRAQLQTQFQNLEYQMYDLERQIDLAHPHEESNILNKKLSGYKQRLVNCQKLKIMMRRWAVASIIKFRNISNRQDIEYNYQEYAKEFESVSLKKLIIKNLKSVLQVLNEKEIEEKKEEEIRKELTPEKKSQLTTQRTQERIQLRDLRSESVLSKEYSRRNFRVKTVASPHEQNLEQKDHQYDEVTQFDFLRHNRKVAKKSNKVLPRMRIKTKA